MANKEAYPDELIQKLDEIGKKTKLIKAHVKEGTDIEREVRELDHLVRDLKAQLGMSAGDKTAYQRESMRKKRAEDPDYRPILRGVRDIPNWKEKM